MSRLLDDGGKCLVDQVSHTQPNPHGVHGPPGLESFLQFGGGGETEGDQPGGCQTAIVLDLSNHLLQVLDCHRAVLQVVDISTVLQ